MKIRECLENVFGCLVVSVLFLVFLPFLLVFFLVKLIMTPYEYIKYRHSRYQKDFPKAYTWMATPHRDDPIYTVIKEENLPIEYIKCYEVYDQIGFFVFRDLLLCFHEPLFFDADRGVWVSYAEDLCPVETPDEDGETFESLEYSEGDDPEEDDTLDRLSFEESVDLLLRAFREHAGGRECSRCVFFYQRNRLEKQYKKAGVESARRLDGMILYEKGEPGAAIREFLEAL